MAQQRKSNLLPIILTGVGVAVLGYVAWAYFLTPWREYTQELEGINVKIYAKTRERVDALKKRAARDRFEMMSLPANPHDAQVEYFRYLDDLVKRNHFEIGGNSGSQGVLQYVKESKVTLAASTTSQINAAKKEPVLVYTVLTFFLKGQATVGHLSNLLQEFDDSPILHRIKNMSVVRLEGKKESGKKESGKKKDSRLVAVQLDIEALIVAGNERRTHRLSGPDDALIELNALSFLMPGPAGMMLVPWVVGPAGELSPARVAKENQNRDYGEIDKKNIFFGKMPKVDVIPELPIGPPEPKNTDPTPEEPPHGTLKMRDYFSLKLITKSFTTEQGLIVDTVEEDAEALMYNPLKNMYARWKDAAGYRKVVVYGSKSNEIEVEGHLKRIDDSTVYFESKGKIYAIHIGQTFAEAMVAPVPNAELIKLGLKVASTKLETEK